MKSPSQSNPADLSGRDRSWRLHPVSASSRDSSQDDGADPSAAESAPSATTPASNGPASPATSTSRLKASSGWIHNLLERVTAVLPSFESAIHRFTIESHAANDAAAIEAALLAAAVKIYPEGRFEFLGLRAAANDQAATARMSQITDQFPTDLTYRDLSLCTGNAFHGRLRLHNRPGKAATHSPAVIQRLNTLCILAASAFENLRHRDEWARYEPIHHDNNTFPSTPLVLPFDASKPIAAPVCSSLRDATFLSAIFPFALSQAQRYRETLSILCVAVDRINAIRQLLGNDVATRVTERAGQIVASTIRSSDIVAKLDDDRIVALLVRAPGYSALHVAQTICRTVAETADVIPELPSITISIGVAAFPNHAHNCFALFDAADDALVQAQSQGHSTVVLAPAILQSLSAPSRTTTNASHS